LSCDALAIAYYPCYHDTVIRAFADQATEDVFNGRNTPAARRACPRELWSTAFRKFDQIDSATDLKDLAILPGNRLEALKGTRKGQHSIRINDQYRIFFRWTEAGVDEVEIVDYHK
jgi:proteic killer suppression protein